MDGREIDDEAVLIRQLAQTRGVGEEDVHASIALTGGIDSLEGLGLIFYFETEYGVSIPDDALSSKICRSIPELARLIRSRLTL